MNNSKLHQLDEVINLVQQGKTLLLAADENLLKKVPKGNWIGGTIPYFMASEGGTITKDKIFATVLPDYVTGTEIDLYDDKSIEKIYARSPENGFTVLILPATSPTHFSYALNAPNYENFAARPVVGWIAGVHLTDIDKTTPKVFNGKTGEVSDKKAIAMRVSLPSNMICDVGIVNIFGQGTGPTLEFLEDNFSVKEVLVDGKKRVFADYVKENKLDLKLPLVANYCGANINVSFQNIDEKNNTVNLYAPVFKGVQYRQAAAVPNYVETFLKTMPAGNHDVLFSCNCILNFLYSELEGKKTGNIVGPVTFGEVAYQLLNQTLVYLTIQKI